MHCPILVSYVLVHVSKNQQVALGVVHVSPIAAVHMAPGGTTLPPRGVAPAGTGVGGLLGPWVPLQIPRHSEDKQYCDTQCDDAFDHLGMVSVRWFHVSLLGWPCF
ncbi:MAG: hypothetical protein KC588_12280 [Nitrospira sp.]|nr:hypothetical protein [Nitrospira sp.]